MKISRTSEYLKRAQLNPERDLTRTDLTYLRRIAENIAKNNSEFGKMNTSLGGLSKLSSEINKIASELKSLNSTLLQVSTGIKSAKG